MRISLRELAGESDWRDEALRTNLWLIPAVESVAAVVLFAVTLRIDQAAGHGDIRLPPWVISGSPDTARQILSSLAGSIITVVGVVFSIMIVTLTLASQQFGPRMLRTFIRDRGSPADPRDVRRDVLLRDAGAHLDREHIRPAPDGDGGARS